MLFDMEKSKMIEKYGKSFEDIAKLKDDFILSNDSLLEGNNYIREIYSKQPLRAKCKLCGTKIAYKKTFHSHGIDYYICENCGHVNGKYLETIDFTSQIYESSEYGDNYRENEKDIYNKRTEKIYIPKVDFLLEVLKNKGIKIEETEFLDVGAGSGYFVGALIERGLNNSCGIEVSPSQVEYGNRMLEQKCLNCVRQEQVCDAILHSSAQVISFIGVLEHVINLDEILEVVNKNSNIKYIYFSVPMFSYSVFVEALFPDVFNRLLGGAHTHVFTDDSLQYLYEKMGWKKLGEWRFGTDAMDIMRTACVKLEKDGNMYLSSKLKDNFSEILDKIQVVIDKSKFCSEIHVVIEK